MELNNGNLDILSKKINELSNTEIIDRIHILLKRSNYPLKEELKNKTDDILLKILEDGIIDDLYKEENETKEISYTNEKIISSRIEFILMKYYYAIYNNNVNLYKKLSNKNISLGTETTRNKLYLLNKELRDMFSNDKDYFEFISMYDASLGTFYNSLGNKDNKEREEVINIFINILKDNKDYLLKNKKNNTIYKNLLTKRNILSFNEDFLKNLSYSQKDIINSLTYNLNEESLIKIKELLIKYPNFSYNTEERLLTDKLLELLSIDEIGNMSEINKDMYIKSTQEEIVGKLNNLLKEHPEFICEVDFIDKEIFTIIDNKTIALLSPEAKEEISKIRKDKNYQKQIKRIVKKDLARTKNIIKKLTGTNESTTEKLPRLKH